jgi:quercetin dioxygenase-like cupin family protein
MKTPPKEPGVWPWPDALDAVVAAPGSHRVVFENQTTRVLEVTIAPGEREPEHTHRWPSVMVVHQPARVSWLDPEGPHSVENIDDHVYRAFRIEFKRL